MPRQIACHLRQGREQQSKGFRGKSMAKSFLLSNEARQGFFQVRFLVSFICSLSANNYVIRQDLMCIIFCPIYPHGNLDKNYDLKRPRLVILVPILAFHSSTSVFPSEAITVNLTMNLRISKSKARLKIEYNIDLKARSLLPNDSTSKIKGR